MNKLYAGYGKADITPMMGIDISGYFKVRKADGVLDPLEVVALALRCDDSTVLMICFDNCGCKQRLSIPLRQHVSEVTGVPLDAILLGVTHTHTGPSLKDPDDPLTEEYYSMLRHKVADAAAAAIADLKPARMGWAVGTAPNVAFVRRFRMKDGSIRTNPGVNNPDILEPIGKIDERVSVLRFDQEGGNSLVFVNFANHPDTVGGCKISGDWPSLMRRKVEKCLDNTRCIFFNGAQGDINHVNVFPKGGDLNDMFMDFDDVSRGYGHARHIGNVVAGAVLQVYDKVAYTDVENLTCLSRPIEVPSNMPAPEDMPQAHYINEMHKAGRDAELPYEAMMLTTMVAKAARMVRLEHGPEFFPMEMCGVALGNLAFITIPGEGFNAIGRELKEAPDWDLVIPCGLTNGYEGYFPTKNAYTEGGYEAGSSPFREGVAELLVEEGKKLLSDLRTQHGC